MSHQPDFNTAAVQHAARSYCQRGWSPIPLPFRGKNPNRSGWQRLRITEETLSQFFNGKPQNVGVLLGEPSGWLIDIDLDHPRCVELAEQFLPSTGATFGRTGKPRSHWVYQATGPCSTKTFKHRTAGMLVEFRSTGAQTVFPPSAHESGEAIEWDQSSPEPSVVDPEELRAAVQRLADAVKAELGETKQQRTKPSANPPETISSTTIAIEPRELCLRALHRIEHRDQSDGSFRLFLCACRCVEHDLDDITAMSVIRQYAVQRPFPRAWSDDEILRRLRDAEKRCARGRALEREPDQTIPLGNRDPATGKLVLSLRRTLPTAEAYLHEFHLHPEGWTLHNHAGLLLVWRAGRYTELEDEAVRRCLQTWLHGALRYINQGRKTAPILVPFESNPGTVDAALQSVRWRTHLPAITVSPAWIDPDGTEPAAGEILACKSALWHLPTMQRIEATPRFFTTTALEFDYDPDAPHPLLWFEFLHQLFDDDIEALQLLQEWFGYVLISDTSQQKMLLIVGPRRGGKGTIARILMHLVGRGNVCGPDTTSLAGPFGLQPLIGKSLAIVSDARFAGPNISTVVERLLCISGEDALTIPRKYKDSVTMKLPTRFLFLTNELPQFTDASGALAGRFLILKLTRSFYGKEDPTLTKRLLPELPGILHWAIEGWHRLHTRGHFVIPASAEDAVKEIEELSSPVTLFMHEMCVVGPGNRVKLDDLYKAWIHWCGRYGMEKPGDVHVFGKQLGAAIPTIVRRRGTGNQPFYDGIALVRQQT